MGQLGIEPQESRKKIAFHVVSRVRPFSTNFISRINGEVTNSTEVWYQSMILPPCSLTCDRCSKWVRKRTFIYCSSTQIRMYSDR